MKYIKLFEYRYNEDKNKIEVAKFVILKTSGTIYWNNWYGINIGKYPDDETSYKIGILTPNAAELDTNHYMKGKFLNVNKHYLEFYETIDSFYQDLSIYYDIDFDELKEQIEMFEAMVNAEKYNL